MERSMKRFALTMALLASTALLPGCVFAIGSTLEQDQGERIKNLDRRISAAEKELGLTPPPAPAQNTQVNE